MQFDLKQPCAECPFLVKFRTGYKLDRLKEFAAGAFPCHKTAVYDEGTEDIETGDISGQGYAIGPNSHACAGALIFNLKRKIETQMMQIAVRLRFWEPPDQATKEFKSLKSKIR